MDQKIVYKRTNMCEDRDTVNTVLEMCKNAPISTQGAMRQPTIRITEYDDGDQGVKVELETFAANDPWSKSMYKFVGELWDAFPDAHLYLDPSQYRLDICTHACDAA